MTSWNTAFWILFVIMGILVVSSTFIQVLFIDITLGFLVVALGILKLSEEFSSREFKDKHGNINESLRYLTHQIDSSNSFTSRLKEKHENRFLHLDTKRAEIEKIVEDKFDALAKKLIEHENKLRDVTKATVEVAKRHDSFVKEADKKLRDVDKIKEKTVHISQKLSAIKPKTLKTTEKKR